MKRIIFILMLGILIFSTGCIKIKGPNCPAVETDTGLGIGVGGATNVLNTGSGDVEVKEKTENLDLTPEEQELPKKVVTEGELVNFPNLDATDLDGDTITYTFSEPFNKVGEWLTKEGDAGKYTVTITASDGKDEVIQKILLVVKPSNTAPVIEIADITLTEGDVLEFAPKVSDADGDEVTVEFSGWKTEFPYTTTFSDSGTHYITVSASDGKTTVEKDVKILVENKNRPPTLEPIDDLVLKEFEELTINPKVADEDGDVLIITYSEPLDASGSWKTKKGDEGKYDVKITVSDGTAETSVTFQIIVDSFNEPPIVTGVEDITVSEGDTVVLQVEAVDPEGKRVDITIEGWMTSMNKEVGYGDAGVYEVLVTVSDGENTVNEVIIITVEDVNRAPVFGAGAFE